jgi:hypothetical protein
MSVRKRVLLFSLVLLVVVGGVAAMRLRQMMQYPDLTWDTAVARPAYPAGTTVHPRVLLDEAHHNFHHASDGGTYGPFVSLLEHDGFTVGTNHAPLTRAVLDSANVLVIANALGARWPFLPGAKRSAFTGAECDVVRDWVRDGGALLLVADHEPMGVAAKELALRFAVLLGTGRAADDKHMEPVRGNPTWLVFSRANGLLGDHAILRGRDSSEAVNTVVSFTGESVRGPDGSVALLKLGPDAVEWMPDGTDVPVGDRAQAVALTFGRGRVVVVGEAAMLTAQVTGGGTFRFGLNWPGTDDRQFTLNVARWLAGALN